MLENHEKSRFKCQILKIPHHGSWPEDNDGLERLLQLADPEFAVLSVGSKNNHGHVKPQLFSKLLELKLASNLRLQGWACTELTRTCVHSAEERVLMDRTGLPHKRFCAGDIVIIAEKSGRWEMKGENEHQQYIRSVEMPACMNRADLRYLTKHDVNIGAKNPEITTEP